MFLETDYDGKRITAGSLFNGKIILGNTRSRTTQVNVVLGLLTRVIIGGLRWIKNKKPSKMKACIVVYPGRDLNPHIRNEYRILSPACLPIPPPGQIS